MEGSLQSPPKQQRTVSALRWRRTAFGVLVLSSSAALLALMAATLFPSGVDATGAVMLMLFAVTLPWTTIGFWNAAIGFAMMLFARHPAGLVAPHLRAITGKERIASATALLVCIRNEDTRRVAANLEWMIEQLVATGEAHWFHLYVLSDTSDLDIAHEENGW